MFIPKIPVEDTILRDYSVNSAIIDTNENINSFENQYITVIMPINTILWFAANNWKCPKSTINRQILSAADWETEKQALIAYGKNLKINTKASLCSTFNKNNTSYLIWLEFTGPDLIKHKLDIFMNEKSKDGTKIYAIKGIDGVLCDTIYNAIINNSVIDPRIAKKLNSIGSVTWTGTAESKTQYKLNSFRQQKLFEKTAAECPFVELRQLDCFDDYLYRGDPGQLADYDLTVTLKNGVKVTTRLDLKLLHDLSFESIEEQNPHDAEIILASALLDTGSVKGGRFFDPIDGIKIEDTEEFKKFIELFKTVLKANPRQYIKIYDIDTTTGKVTYSFFS